MPVCEQSLLCDLSIMINEYKVVVKFDISGKGGLK